MGVLKKLSLRVLADRFGQSLKRFPLAMLLVIFLTGCLIYFNHGGDPGDKLEFFLIFYPATGALLAVALSLLTEDFKSKIAAVLTQVVLHAAWFGVSVYLAQFDRFSLPQMIAVSATVAAFGFAVFLLCFYRKNQEMPFWNFSVRTILSLALSGVIGGILTLGLMLLVESLKMLFGLDIKNEVYMDIWTVCMVLLAPSLFMILIPKGENKYLTEAPEFSRFTKGVVQYLFLPLLGLYMITLYAYAAKILLQWSLPVGNVSYLVTGSMLLMVLLIYLTYPLQHLEGNKMFKGVTRWLPVLMLPLLALMTVAIARRLSDYGITVSRLYLLVFNIWCYCVCLWLIFTRNKRIWLIPASFAVILFLISVGPQSIPNITQRQLLSEARSAFAASGITQLPLSGEQYDKWLKDVDPEVATSIDSKLNYLQDYYGFNSTQDLLAKDVITGTFIPMGCDHMIESTSNIFCNDDLINNVEIPVGYSRMSLVNFHSDKMLKDGDIVQIRIVPTTGPVVPEDALENDLPVASPPTDVEYLFEIAAKQLIERDQDRNPQDGVKPLLINDGQALLMINRFSFSFQQNKFYYLSGDGILFTK